MILAKVRVSREQLNAIPKNERIFFIQIGNLLNDFNILQKLIFISAKYTDDTLERRGRNLQALFFVRLLAGKLWEAWQLLEKDFFGAKLSQRYESCLDINARDSLEKLKQYFSRKNLTYKIRNEYAFHYCSSKNIEKQVNAVPKEEIFELLLAEEHGNCLYSLSDVILNFTLLNAVNPSNPEEAMETILSDTCNVTKYFLDFLGGCLVIVWDKYVGGDAENIEINDPPVLDDLLLPYFIRR